MPLYLVSYDLREPEMRYVQLSAALRQLGATRVLVSTWVLRSPMRATPLMAHLVAGGELNATDPILVTELTGDAEWRNVAVDDATMRALLDRG